MATEYADNHPLDAISALADGQLRADAFARAVEAVAQEPEALASWRAYHVIGDVMRSQELADHADDNGFLARFQARLEQEPALVSAINATNLIAIKAYTSSAEAGFDAEEKPRAEAANAPQFAWKLVAGLASVLAVVVVGWNVAGSLGSTASAPQIAQLQQPAGPATTQTVAVNNGLNGEPQVMLRDARLDALMAAHKQFGGTSALQMPAGFLRNATFESSAP